MQRQRGELVPIGEAIADLPGPVKRSATLAPGASPLHPLRSGEPVVSASEADPDLGFMART